MPKLYLFLCLSLLACQAPVSGNPQPTASPSASVSASPSPTTTPTATPTSSASASPTAVPSASTAPAVFKLGESFELSLNQEKQADGEDLNVKFVAVPEDSRCPSDVTCVWAGQVKVTLALSKNGQAAENQDILLSGGSENAEITWKEYKIALLEVAPYPKSGQDQRDAYRIQLQVTRTN